MYNIITGLEASSFTGNDLCGPPLPDCKENVETPEHENGGKDGSENGVDWFGFYVSMAPGFVVGFWGFIGPLLINKRWSTTQDSTVKVSKVKSLEHAPQPPGFSRKRKIRIYVVMLLKNKKKTSMPTSWHGFYVFRDLSKNLFSREIPREVTSLAALRSLNLSDNSFTGRIPENIGAMREIESIELSSNQLSGKIPQSISSLTFLSQLNLSNNNLSGKNPLSTQLQGFEATGFTGNDRCGSPLPNCTVTVETPGYEDGGGKDSNEHEVDWFYVSMALDLLFVSGV
ncbi:hypothetical protein Ddye_027492 [Dipteronia dyeriana]|uniref:Uncharacterized protein n=1 Tax=Dipteronia dyeriana TaxID=168575 RepID=A0AAD9TP80_9ROSI|nr:hypothetical protein Ddye_027492 [Dipteronia dyeriana]